MSEIKKRGRKAGTTKIQNVIHTNLMGNFSIYVEKIQGTEYPGYNIMEKNRQSPLDFFTNLDKAIEKLAKYVVIASGETFTIKGFKDKIHQIETQIKNSL